MRRNIFLKSTLRQPLRTALLFLLIVAAAFALLSRTLEYIAIVNETDSISEYYRSIGMLEWDDQFLQDLSKEEIIHSVSKSMQIVSGSRYVMYDDWRMVSSGVMREIYNADISGLGERSPEVFDMLSKSQGKEMAEIAFEYPIHVSNVFMYGIVNSITYIKSDAETQATPESTNAGGYYSLSFTPDSVVTGYPEYVYEGDILSVMFFPQYWSEAEAEFEDLEVGVRYLVRTYGYPYTRSRKVELRMMPLTEGGPAYLKAEPGRYVDFSDPAYADLEAEIALIRENQHAMEVWSSRDMSAMKEVQEGSRDYYLVDGRWLDYGDESSGSCVCVVSSAFALTRGLSLGDTITITFRKLEMPLYGYIVQGTDRESWREYPTYDEEYKIVGLFSVESDDPTYTQYINRIYIPYSTFPIEYSINDLPHPEYSYASYIFVLTSSKYQEAFLAETRDALAVLGVSAVFIENGFESFWDSVSQIRQPAAMNAVAFAGVASLTLALSAFLYLRQRRKDFAIARALGSPSGAAIRKILLPIVLIGSAAVSLGGLISRNRALTRAVEALSTVTGTEGADLEGMAISTGANALEVPAMWIIILCAAILAVLTLFVAVGAILLAKRPALELFGEKAKSKAAGKFPPKHESEPMPMQEPCSPEEMVEPGVNVSGVSTQPPNHPQRTGKTIAAAQIRYVFRQIRRSPLKTMLTVAVAFGVILALGWMIRTIERVGNEIDGLFDNSVVGGAIMPQGVIGIESTIDGVIKKQTVDSVIDMGLIKNLYLEAGASRVRLFAQITDTDQKDNGNAGEKAEDGGDYSFAYIYAFSNANRFFATAGSGIHISYGDGWDSNFFSKSWTPIAVKPNKKPSPIPVVVSEHLSELLNIGVGDAFTPVVYRFSEDRECVVVGTYTGSLIIGHTKNIADESFILIPWPELVKLHGDGLTYSTVEFTIDRAKNREFLARRDDINALVDASGAGYANLHLLLRDEELRMAVAPMEKTRDLLVALYPIAVAASLFLALALALLLALQKAKDAAVMRVLGASIPRIWSALCIEQFAVCATGLLLGLAALSAVNGGIYAALDGALMCAALYFACYLLGTFVASLINTGRKPMELLQVKE